MLDKQSKNFHAKSIKFTKLFVPLHTNMEIMIITSNTVTTDQPTKSVTTRERVIASTMSVDEYFDELISQVHEDYADY